MKNLFTKVATLATIISIGLFQLNYSSRPPIDKTNRISGQNCTNCHAGSLNPSGGSLSISGPTAYYPGRKYKMTIMATGASRYGFEMTAVQSSNTSNAAGSFSGTGIDIQAAGGGRPAYARHSSKSSTGIWNVDWTSPTGSLGSVKFFVAGVAANNNGGNSGDKTYATTKTITMLSKMSVTTTNSHVSCSGGSDGKIKITNVTGGAGSPFRYAWSGSTSTADSLTGLKAGSYSVSVYDKDSNLEVKAITLTQGTPILAQMGADSSICEDSTGRAWATPTGGKSPYTFQWPAGTATSNDTAIHLRRGMYAVTITDANGCAITDSVAVGNSGSNIQLVLGANPEYCSNAWGEAFVLSVSNNIGAVSYQWSNLKSTKRIDSLTSATYTVTVTDGKGCKATKSVAVAKASNTITASLILENDKCNQKVGSAKVSGLNGGVSPYTYSWSQGGNTDSIGGLAATVYSLTVTDSVGCTGIFSDTIKDESAPQLSMRSTNLQCYGDSSGTAKVTVAGGKKPYQYRWSNGRADSSLLNLQAGKYIVTVSDSNSCLAIDSVMLMQPDLLELDSLLQTDDGDGQCDAEARIKVKGGTKGYSYLWNDPKATADSIVKNLCEGKLNVTVTDASGCSFSSEIMITDKVLEAIAELNQSQITFYPNPVKDVLNLVGVSNLTQIQLWNISGKMLFSRQVENDKSLDLTGLPNGVYYLRVEQKDIKPQVVKLMKIGY